MNKYTHPIYFIIHGLIKTHKIDEKGNEQILSLLKTGDMFPHTGQFGSNPYPTTATTVINTELFALPISSFEQILAGSPSIAFKMMAVMASEIRELHNKLQGFTSRNLEDRGISFLIKLAEDFGIRIDGNILINVPRTHQEIANLIGFTRQSVTRLLSSLCKEGLLTVNRKGFLIHNLQALRERVCVKENCAHCREHKLYERS
ncbi:Crp/Fnr family transcriptional regulator [Paenibacillus lutimineralis]